MKNSYLFGFSINNGGTWAYNMEETNFRRACKLAREMAIGNCPVGNSGYWTVRGKNNTHIKSGTVRKA